jgi:hypothetical protein
MRKFLCGLFVLVALSVVSFGQETSPFVDSACVESCQ